MFTRWTIICRAVIQVVYPTVVQLIDPWWLLFKLVKVPYSLANTVLALKSQLPRSMPLQQSTGNFHLLGKKKSCRDLLLEPVEYSEALALVCPFAAKHVQAFAAELKFMCTHLGFCHVHNVVHIALNLDAGYPMLISAFSETTLQVMTKVGFSPSTNLRSP